MAISLAVLAESRSYLIAYLPACACAADEVKHLARLH